MCFLNNVQPLVFINIIFGCSSTLFSSLSSCSYKLKNILLLFTPLHSIYNSGILFFYSAVPFISESVDDYVLTLLFRQSSLSSHRVQGGKAYFLKTLKSKLCVICYNSCFPPINLWLCQIIPGVTVSTKIYLILNSFGNHHSSVNLSNT